MSELTKNRKAFFNYEIHERFEAGISLQGTEVKSCRAKNVSLDEAYARIRDGELWLENAHIATYEQGNRNNHDPRRNRRLLLRKSELRRLAQATQRRGFTIVPLSMYLKRGKVKVEVALCRGKRKPDKRETLRRQQQDEEARRAMKRA